MTGIIIIDKPAGWTSHDVVAKIRGALRNAERSVARGSPPADASDDMPRSAKKAARVGHGGTLDPLATGVLPVFIGRATRAAEFCENAEKEYIAGLKLGLVTDTQDIEGNMISNCGASCGACRSPVSTDDILSVIPRFLGAQKQTPPMYSAVKIDGKKLYESARQGIEVPRPARDITISDIELVDGANDEFLLRVVCSKGTYIRTLCHDIGAALGCGGVMCSLRRTRAGAFSICAAYPLEDVLKAIGDGKTESVIIPVDAIFSGYPAATLNGHETHKCRNGAPCHAGQITDGTYRFYGPDNEFLLLGEIKSGNINIIKSFFEV